MIKPKQDHLVLEIEEIEKEKKTKSGIYIQSASAQFEKQNKGVVVAKGPGRFGFDGRLIPIDAEIGETVLFNAFAGTEVRTDDKLYLIIRENDVIASL